MQKSINGRKLTISYWSSRFILIILALLGIVPFILALYLSLRNNVEIATEFWSLPRVLHWDNYKVAFEGISMPIVRSILLSCATIVLVIIMSSYMSYIFAKMKFPGKEIIFTMYTVVMMIPSVLTMTPLFMTILKLHLLGSYWAIILPYLGFWQVFGIIISVNSYKSIPDSLFEAARVEGAGDFYCFSKIGLPLTIPVMITIAITSLLAFYNDYLWPVLVLDGGKKLFSMFVVELGSGNSSDMGITSAAYVIGSIPLILLTSAGLKYYLQGALNGAVKE